MHVGVNLRAAEVRGLNRFINEQSNKSVGIDLIVHSTCKLLGHLGVNPEYRRGVIGFPEFLRATLDDARAANAPNEQLDSTAEAISVKLERQVGSHYYVTSRNAGRIFFLAPYTINYIHSLERTKELNNLEKDVLQYLTNDLDKALLKVDGIFFDAIYADLMCLLKSTKLSKKDMNPHFLELLEHLQLCAKNPRFWLDPQIRVFKSEPRLYAQNALNHRTHSNYIPVRNQLYCHDEFNEEFTFPLFASASGEMAQKLKTYKEDQLPGGKHWDTSPSIREALKDLEPTNDACESILGLNDWLQKTTPNMTQRTVLAMVQTKKNRNG